MYSIFVSIGFALVLKKVMYFPFLPFFFFEEKKALLIMCYMCIYLFTVTIL